ncbi:hypothetical protein [Microbulbifer epialgicus]|uniref:Uncharacterized protein n=1 Tax=Microbulbifer epialgicus TaxID=393907 RepID=A0ABV4P5I3_9GAMM
MQGVKELTNPDEYTVASSLLNGGIVAVGYPAVTAAMNSLSSGALESAALVGIETATIGVVVAAAAIVVIAIGLLVLWLMKKPATCAVLIVNETDADLAFNSGHNVHGKQGTHTKRLRKSWFPDKNCNAGFYSAMRHDNSITHGSQYGFTLSGLSSGLVGIGVECPLTGVLGGNNRAYCSFDESAEQITYAVNDHDELSDSASNGDYRASIRCNSGSGSIAYFIGRIYKA